MKKNTRLHGIDLHGKKLMPTFMPGNKLLTPVMVEKNKTPDSFSLEAIEFLATLIDPSKLHEFAQLVERPKLEKEALVLSGDIGDLTKTLNQKQERLDLVYKLLGFQTPDNQDNRALIISKTNPDKNNSVTQQNDTNRYISGRNKAVYDYIKKQNNWVFRTEIEENLDDIKLNKMRLDEPEKVYEETRQILRRARESNWVIAKPVYTIGTKNGRVFETFMYGIKDFEENTEMAAVYNSNFVKKASELGLFVTKEEADDFKRHKANNGQILLDAH